MAMTDATVKKILIPLGSPLVRSGVTDTDAKKYALVIGLGAITDDDGDFTPADYIPVGWSTVEFFVCQARTLGTSATAAPLVAVTTFAVEYAGSSATTFDYLMVVSKTVG